MGPRRVGVSVFANICRMRTSSHRPIGPTPSAALAREIQRRSGLSQAKLARRAGLPRSVVNVYLKGRREPGADSLARLAAAAGLRLGVEPRRPAVDPERASERLTQ